MWVCWFDLEKFNIFSRILQFVADQRVKWTYFSDYVSARSRFDSGGGGGRMTAALCWSPGSCSSGRRRKEGSAVFVVFLALPCFKYKATTHTLTVRQTPLSHGGKTDQSLCVCVCVSPSPLMGQMARQESWGCLQSCALKSSAEQGIICLRRPSVTLAPLVLHNGHSCTAVIFSREIREFFSFFPSHQ